MALPVPKAFAGLLRGRAYMLAALILLPLHILLALVLRAQVRPRSVVHIGELRHLQHHLVQTLKDRGYEATYLAIGDNPHWSRCDVHLPHLRNPFAAAIRDGWVFWTVVARHQVVHCHGMMGVSHYLWEMPILKLLGRRIIAHFRGCEGRDRSNNIAMHPEINICQDCDYAPDYLCMNRETVRRRWMARRFADRVVVTTPDLKDFWPAAEHLPFLLPPDLPQPPAQPDHSERGKKFFKIVHVTNQPGIEGTDEIKRIIDGLKNKGHPIEFVHLTDVSHDQVLSCLVEADLSIGKMKMGYYANAQVESLAVGVPAITWVRPDLMGEGLSDGLIVASLADLESTLERTLTDPDFLNRHRQAARETIRKRHDADAIVRQLSEVYGWE